MLQWFAVFLALLAINSTIYAAPASPKVLNVLTRNAPTTFYYGANNQKRGFEYDLVNAFAASQGYRVNFIVKYSIKEVLEALERGEADFAAAGLTHTAQREKLFLMGPHYFDVQEQVVCGYTKRPKTLEDLPNYQLEIIQKSSYVETMHQLQKRLPDLHWIEHEGYTTEHIFERISKHKIECTLADSHIIAINRRYYPHMNVSFAVSEKEHLVWMFPKTDAAVTLRDNVKEWFEHFKDSKQFHSIKDSYFSHVEIFDYVDVSIYHRRISTLLPRYIHLFRAAGKRHRIDWRLLAALAYQESHWNPNATSPTGVRGMMMLTHPTALQMGITNRLDANQSINGGARYIAKQIRHAPKRVKGMSERIKFALAGYNVGRGHIYDAILLGKKLGYDPYLWVNMKKILPLLSERTYFKDLKYGYARGQEPVDYVRRITNYYDILRQHYKW